MPGIRVEFGRDAPVAARQGGRRVRVRIRIQRVADADRRRILVRHALSMTMGLEWDESLPYTDPRNSEIAMELAPDRYRFHQAQRRAAGVRLGPVNAMEGLA